MSGPVHVALPHTLGKDEARQRLKTRIGDLPDHIPGGVASVQSEWPSDDVMQLNVAAMGQQVAAKIVVLDNALDVTIDLPPMLGFFGDIIRKAVEAKGGQLLLDDDSKRDR
ncbi:MAG: hypothetical protein GW859_10490 [Sphingomonadales bacterium]|nr:hypothetical protein [Sphingomonadales bacterium]